MFSTKTTKMMSIITWFRVTFLRMKESCIWNHIFMLNQIYWSIKNFLLQTVKQRSSNCQNLLILLLKSFLHSCLFFKRLRREIIAVNIKLKFHFYFNYMFVICHLSHLLKMSYTSIIPILCVYHMLFSYATCVYPINKVLFCSVQYSFLVWFLFYSP